jgi:hypothetical protein
VKTTCGLVTLVMAIAVLAMVRAQPAKPALAGAWTLNADLSDKPGEQGQKDDDRAGGRGGGGGRAGGGIGRGGGMGRRGDPQAAARMRDALREVTNPADRLTIVQTDSMVIITSSEGHTTRLAPGGSKVKDEHTNVERRTRWESGRLVSEISGLGPGKMTQTFAVDADGRHLRVTLLMEGGRDSQPLTVTHVYDANVR